MSDVRAATADDIALVAQVAAAGFYSDPVLSWIFQDDHRRRAQLVHLFTGLARDMIPSGGTVHIAGDSSAALWRNPSYAHGRTSRDRVDDDAEPEGPELFAPDELERLAALGSAMMAAHPHEPHWYLNVVSTVPERQGQGLGAAVLQPVLARCDAEGHRAYLESSNPRNLSLYWRQGFVDTGEIRIDGGPSLTPMWREPRD